MVCCDGCGIEADPYCCEYFTVKEAVSARDWITRQGGWLWQKPNTDDEWLTCPECAAMGR